MEKIQKLVSRNVVMSNICQACWVLYLEKLKQHMVEMGWHIDNVEWLVGVFGCEKLISGKNKSLFLNVAL